MRQGGSLMTKHWKLETDGLVVTELTEPIMVNSKQEMGKVEKLRTIL